MFRKKANEKEVMRKVDRDLKGTQRGLERDRAKLEREEQKLTLEIKKAAKQGNKQAATVLAKQLVNLRKQKTRMYGASARVSSINAQAKVLDDTLEAMFEESGDEEEQDAIVNQVLDEIGIEVAGKLSDAPTASYTLPAGKEKTRDTADQEIEAQLARLLKN
ncbi:charged multivesicular body protein 2b-like [Acanthaster planci]|uniref:Charged multivesicular body protein 2b-like n=1 Tax=Acanthaster planci TaxID=133434 RepID=A0A8B7ZW64_ACAPL|nr:charged multivesicular body protein 2b-like [Acanthaster planci]